MRSADVYYKDRFAGVLVEDEGVYRFQYDDLYRIDGMPIAFNIPIRQAPYEWHHMPPFFDNLVSEGWLRRLQSQRERVDESDSFGLLLANGRDLVGAVSVVPSEEKYSDL